MTTIPQLTGAPLVFTAHGVSYKISPLTDGDFGELILWIQDRITAIAKRMCQGMPAEDRQAVLNHAFDKAMKVQLNSPEATEYLTSLEGGVMIAWMGLRHEQPTITREEVVKIMEDPELAGDMMKKIQSLRELHSIRPFVQGMSKKEQRQARKKPQTLRRRST